MKKNLLVAAWIATAGLLAGCVVTPDYYGEPVYVEPPPPRVEYPGYPPITGYIWIGGYWNWTGHRHEWVPGRWDAPRPGYRWTPPRWERDGRGWRQHEGRWDHDGGPSGGPAQRVQPQPRYERQETYRPPPAPVQAPASAPFYRQERDSGPGPSREVQPPRREPESRPQPPQGMEQRNMREAHPEPGREAPRGERNERRRDGDRDERHPGHRGPEGDR